MPFGMAAASALGTRASQSTTKREPVIQSICPFGGGGGNTALFLQGGADERRKGKSFYQDFHYLLYNSNQRTSWSREGRPFHSSCPASMSKYGNVYSVYSTALASITGAMVGNPSAAAATPSHHYSSHSGEEKKAERHMYMCACLCVKRRKRKKETANGKSMILTPAKITMSRRTTPVPTEKKQNDNSAQDPEHTSEQVDP